MLSMSLHCQIISNQDKQYNKWVSFFGLKCFFFKVLKFNVVINKEVQTKYIKNFGQGIQKTEQTERGFSLYFLKLSMVLEKQHHDQTNTEKQIYSYHLLQDQKMLFSPVIIKQCT